jgi:hypothetical protein
MVIKLPGYMTLNYKKKKKKKKSMLKKYILTNDVNVIFKNPTKVSHSQSIVTQTDMLCKFLSCFFSSHSCMSGEFPKLT